MAATKAGETPKEHFNTFLIRDDVGQHWLNLLSVPKFHIGICFSATITGDGGSCVTSRSLFLGG